MQAAELAARVANAAQAAASTAAIGKSSSFYGVMWHAGMHKWHAYVNRRGGTKHRIDYYDIEADAARAVDEWLLEHGEDRENFDADDNRIVRQSTHSSIYRGVHWDKSKGKWAASIKVDNKTEHLGTYDTQKEAAKAFDERAWELGRGTNFRLDGTCNNLGPNGKVVPQVRPELWTRKLRRQSA